MSFIVIDVFIVIGVNHVGIIGLFDVRVSNDLERVWEVGHIQYGELCLVFKAILGGGGASVRHLPFFRGERLLQTVHLREGGGAFI